MIFEVCATNLTSALAAQVAGAQRIELCSALDVGGLTPSLGLIRTVIKALNIQVHVLIRPREGDFCYTDAELELMLEDIRICREAGAAGVVVGALDQSGKLDLSKMKDMKHMASGLEITCHRAFDFTPDTGEALEQLIAMGFTRILSSGQSLNAYEGRSALKKLILQAGDRIEVMPGGGIDATNIRAVAEFTGARQLHFTGKQKRANGQIKELPGLSNWHWESDPVALSAMINLFPS